MIYYVYEIYDTYGNCVYVGQTIRPKIREAEHLRWRKKKYFGCVFVVVAIYDKLTDALAEEGRLKLEYGMEWVEVERGRRGGKKAALTNKKNGNLNRLAKMGTEASRRFDDATEQQIYLEYTQGFKQTYEKLAIKYGCNKKTIARVIQKLTFFIDEKTN